MTLIHLSKQPAFPFKADRFDVRSEHPHVFWFTRKEYANWGAMILGPGDSIVDENGALIHSIPDDYKSPDTTVVMV